MIFAKTCYKTHFFLWIVCRFPGSAYLCIVFLIVLDLRLTKVGLSGAFFYVHTQTNSAIKEIKIVSNILPKFYTPKNLHTPNL